MTDPLLSFDTGEASGVEGTVEMSVAVEKKVGWDEVPLRRLMFKTAIRRRRTPRSNTQKAMHV